LLDASDTLDCNDAILPGNELNEETVLLSDVTVELTDETVELNEETVLLSDVTVELTDETVELNEETVLLSEDICDVRDELTLDSIVDMEL